MLNLAMRIGGTYFASRKDDAIAVMPDKGWLQLHFYNFTHNRDLLIDYFWNIAPEEDRHFNERLK